MTGSLFLVAWLLQYNGCGPPPGYQGPGDQPPPLAGQPPVSTGTPGPNRPSTPGPATPGPNTPGPSTPGPGPSAGPRTGGGAGGGPRTGGVDLGPELDWRDWWWLNGYEYFKPQTRREVTTGDGGAADASGAPVDRELVAVREVVRKALKDPDDRVRASAALTAGRLYDASLRAPLLALLEDGNPLVRQSAIAGLGLAATEEDSSVLLQIGTIGKNGTARANTAEERDLALFSLGIGATRGSTLQFAPALKSFLTKASNNDRRSLGPSAALSLGLANDDEILLQDLVAIAKDGKAPPAVRARALWAFRNRPSWAKTLRPVVLTCLKDKDAVVRAAAALALGRLAIGAKDEVLTALRASIDSEGDTAVRAFSLLAIGEVGGPEAKKELLERVTRGKQLIRPWAAIGAGLAGRKDRDPELGRSLAKALAEEKNKDTRAALVLGIGLAKSADAREMVRHIVVNGEHGRERVFAAVAVALGEDEDGRPTLRKAMKDIPSPSSRATMALALSTFSNVEDLPSLLESFQSADEPGVIGTSALALAWHGTPPALETLRRDIETAKQAERRAVALLALGIGVAPERVPVSITATGGWNYLASLEAAHTAARLWM